jgi:Lamin Tail Domain/Secretion system C-terminal sorting domain
MKKFILSIVALAAAFNAFAQTPCSELFISEYIEGTNTNKAIGIYNPTNAPVNLAGYSLGRFSNGASSLSSTTLIQLSGTIQPYDEYVFVISHADTTIGGQDQPVWNGYQKMALNTDAVTGLPQLGANGDSLYRALTYNTASAKFQWESTYKSRWDLKGRADQSICPVYATNNTMYHNGDDAMALIKGSNVANPNVIDAVGVIGEDPGTSWTDPNAASPYLIQQTQDRTLVRKPTINSGLVLISDGGTTVFNAGDWKMYSQNYFLDLGKHCSICDPGYPLCPVSTENKINKVVFNLFPNPVHHGMVSLRTTENIVTTTITDLVGRTIRTEKGSNLQSVDMTNLIGGVYVVTVTAANGAQGVQKVVVQ